MTWRISHGQCELHQYYTSLCVLKHLFDYDHLVVEIEKVQGFSTSPKIPSKLAPIPFPAKTQGAKKQQPQWSDCTLKMVGHKVRVVNGRYHQWYQPAIRNKRRLRNRRYNVLEAELLNEMINSLHNFVWRACKEEKHGQKCLDFLQEQESGDTILYHVLQTWHLFCLCLTRPLQRPINTTWWMWWHSCIISDRKITSTCTWQILWTCQVCEESVCHLSLYIWLEVRKRQHSWKVLERKILTTWLWWI